MSEEILFLSHRIPFPPNRGDKIRSHHILRSLARQAPVHVATFCDDDADMAEEAELAAISKSYRLVRRSLPLLLAGVQGLLRQEPVSLPAFYSSELSRYVARVIEQRQIGTIYVFSGQMGQYVPSNFEGRVIVDFVDVDSAKFDAYAQNHSGPERWVHRREGKLLRLEEVRLALRATHNFLISTEEAALFASRMPAEHRESVPISVLGNGIDSDFFDPNAASPEPQLLAMPRGRMIFTGQMDYPPNIAAVTRFAGDILPRIRNQLPEASFHIVGRNPTEDVLELAKLPGCHVWGGVPDIRCWLAAADIAVTPLEIARGVQNKVLEAMAMRLPVVLSSGAATGIAAASGQDFLVADSDAEFASKAVGLLLNSKRAAVMGKAARQFVVQNQSWQAALAPLEQLFCGSLAPKVRNAA